jgi:replication factor C subunit 3/5
LNIKEKLWEFKYSPKSVDEMILSDLYKKIFSDWINNNELGNCLLYSQNPGSGKTTIMNLIKDSENFISTFINASRETSIDTVRYNINKFVSTISYNDAIKVVLLDEADRLSPQALDALKSEIELKVNNARFVFSANRESAFPDPIKSRLKIFNFDKMFTDNKDELYKSAYKRIEYILNSENIEFEPKAIATIIKKYAPDWRNIIKTCQLLSAYSKKILLEDVEKIDVKNDISDLVNYIKQKNFKLVREFSVKHIGNEQQIMTELYKLVNTNIITNESKVKLILILSEMNRYINIVPDPEIELIRALVDIMTDMEFIEDD